MSSYSKEVPVNLPKAGMGIEEGTVARWLKTAGELVEKGEVLVEIETAKALQEVEAPVTGRLLRILAKPGQTLAVNTALAIIEPTDAPGPLKG